MGYALVSVFRIKTRVRVKVKVKVKVRQPRGRQLSLLS